MYIRDIRIRSFRHLESVRLGPFDQPPAGSDLVVLAGPNGGGKSSILELLGYALSQSWSLNWQLRRSFPNHAFEVAIALTPEERKLVREFVGNARYFERTEISDYLAQHGTYYRSYNFPDGEYQKNAGLHNALHEAATQALRNHYRRPTGFFLKSDRHYPVAGFRRDSLFEYEQKTQVDHIWSMAFQTSDVQYSDMYEFLLQQRYHYDRRLGAYHRRLTEQGPAAAGTPPTDPIKPYDNLLQTLFPGYGFAEQDGDVPSNLFVRIPSGETIPFSDLSSGEKEVFFILSFFLRHSVSNAIVVVDEPELHLHPELSRILIKTMQSIRPSNQIWLATHNAEVIDEAGRDRVTYVARDATTRKAVVTAAVDEAEAIQKLRDLFGYSGYIGVAKSMVFLEGIETSADRKTFANLFPQYGSQIKFIPAQSTVHHTKLNSAILSILESNLGWMKFYLIRDRDYLTEAMASHYKAQGKGRLYVLDRCHIENYLLDEKLIARTAKDIFNIEATAEAVLATLRRISTRMSGEVLRDMAASRLNILFQAEDFSLGQIFHNERFIDDDGKWIDAKLDQFTKLVQQKVAEVNTALQKRVEPTALNAILTDCKTAVSSALDSKTDGWKINFPGKAILQAYAKEVGIGKSVALVNSLIKELATMPDAVPPELRTVIATIAEGRSF